MHRSVRGLLVSCLLFAPACVENNVKVVQGTNLDAPLIAVEPGTLDYGGVALGSVATQALTIRNEGDADLTLSHLSIVGGGASYFALLEGLDDSVIAPGGSAAVDVAFTANGDPGLTSVRIDSDDAANPELDVPIEAELLFGQLSVNPNPVDFGDSAPGAVVHRSATITNVGGLDVSVSGLMVSGTRFDLPEPPALPLTLPPGAGLPVDLTYAPVEEGVDTGYLWVTSDDPVGVRSVPLAGSSGLSTDETPDDPEECLSDSTGYDTNAGARLIVTQADAIITVTYLGSDAGYSDDLWLYSPEAVRLAQGHVSSVGQQVTLGPYALGTELIFGIAVNDTGDHWKSGEASRNHDGEVHGAITYNGGCSWAIGFEDLAGGGDRDYNDIIMRVEGALIEQP